MKVLAILKNIWKQGVIGITEICVSVTAYSILTSIDICQKNSFKSNEKQHKKSNHWWLYGVYVKLLLVPIFVFEETFTLSPQWWEVLSQSLKDIKKRSMYNKKLQIT